jgi:hypothetical protein
MRHQTKTLTADEFDAIRKRLTNFEEKNLDAARRILVDKARQTDVARDLNVSTGAVSAMVRRIWNTYLEHGKPPEGWKTVNVALPQPMADVVTEMARVAREKAKQ